MRGRNILTELREDRLPLLCESKLGSGFYDDGRGDMAEKMPHTCLKDKRCCYQSLKGQFH